MSESVFVFCSKTKPFCFLAVLVLGLGIGGVTTQFTVVNAIMLRGFSFPHPEQLMSVGLIDPQASDQNNNFGNGNIPSAQDYEDLHAGQKSFALMTGYLNGSTINVTYKNTPQRYTGGYVTEDFFKIIDVSPIIGRDFTAEDNKPGAEKVTILGDEIWKRDFDGDPHIVGQAFGLMAKPPPSSASCRQILSSPVSKELWMPLYNEFPPEPRGDSCSARTIALLPSWVGSNRVSLSIRRTPSLSRLRNGWREDNPKTNQNLTSASVQPLCQSVHRASTEADQFGPCLAPSSSFC